MIGKNSKDWVFRQTNATTEQAGGGPPGEDVNVGDPAGYFEGKNICNISPTFCPEHGIIMMVGVARMDTYNTSGQGQVHLCKQFQPQYWSPEYETRRTGNYCQRIFGTSHPAGANFESRIFEEYRKPSNQWAENADVANSDQYVHAYADAGALPGQYKTLDPTIFNSLFTGNLGGSDLVHYQVFNEARLRKKSPVKPPQFISGVS